MDVGSGYGDFLVVLKELGYKHLFTADIENTAEETFKTHGIHFTEFDATKDTFPFPDGSFDVVVCSHILEHLPSPFHLLGEARRILRAGGVLFIMVPDWQKHPSEFYNDPTHIHPYTKQGVARALHRAEFNDITIKSHGCFRGLGRIKAWRFWKGALFTGEHIIGIAKK
jgi:SAM-dependent methyltransferase